MKTEEEIVEMFKKALERRDETEEWIGIANALGWVLGHDLCTIIE